MLATKMVLEIEKSLIYLRALKQLPASQLRAEARLTRRLQELFAGVAERTIQELMKHNRLPTDDATMRLVISHILGASDNYKETLGEEALQAAQYGRNRIIRELQRLGVSVSFSEF